MTNEEMREMSGNVKASSRLVSFLYLLLRDEVTAGTVERIVDGVEASEGESYYTNGWLAQYAKCLADRLMK